MIKLIDIAKSVIKGGGKLFGTRASRVSTQEMNLVFKEIYPRISSHFSKIQLSDALKSKVDHGDIDVVLLNDKKLNGFETIKSAFGQNMIDFDKNGNMCSILYRSDSIKKDVHIDFLFTSTEEDYNAQFDYLKYGDFSGILGVLARRVRFNYGTKGFFKIYEDKRGQYHYILLTKNLREGLMMLGYKDVLDRYDKIENVDDVANFIMLSPFFDSSYYEGQDMNHSDRKRVRSGRPSADYVRKKLIESNKKRSINDDNYFVRSLFPEYYKKLEEEIHRIETFVIPKSKYNGEWLMNNFPSVKPGPIVGRVLKHWHDLYKEKLDNVSEEELKQATQKFLTSLK